MKIECPSGYKINFGTGLCELVCDPQCETCYNYKSNCISCKATDYRYEAPSCIC